MARIRIVAAMAAVVLVLGGCSAAGGPPGGAMGSSPPKPDPPRAREPDGGRGPLPDRRPDIAGVVTRAESGDGGTPTQQILVEEDPDAECRRGPVEAGCDKLYLALRPETGVFRGGGAGAVARADAAELREGRRVRAWHTGMVMESYPGRTGARAVVILSP